MHTDNVDLNDEERKFVSAGWQCNIKLNAFLRSLKLTPNTSGLAIIDFCFRMLKRIK